MKKIDLEYEKRSSLLLYIIAHLILYRRRKSPVEYRSTAKKQTIAASL